MTHHGVPYGPHIWEETRDEDSHLTSGIFIIGAEDSAQAINHAEFYGENVLLNDKLVVDEAREVGTMNFKDSVEYGDVKLFELKVSGE